MPKVNEDFRNALAAGEDALAAHDLAAADTWVAAAEAASTSEDERYRSALQRLSLEIERKNEPGQMRALQIVSANPGTPADQVNHFGALYNYMAGSQAMDRRKPAEAIALLLRARALGAEQPELPVLLANAFAATGRPAEAVAQVDGAIQASKAAGRKPPADWYRFAIPRVHALGDRAALTDWLTRFIQDYPTVQNWRWAIQLLAQGAAPGGGEKVERIDLYRLLRSTNALADRGDYADYAYAVQQAGLPWEAVAVIDEGRKAGKLPTVDRDVQQTYASAQAGVKSEGLLDTLARQAKTGHDACRIGDAFLAAGDHARAVELYDQALQKGGAPADAVNLHRGIALKTLGRKDEARTAFRQVNGGLGDVALLWQASVDAPPLS